MDSIRKNYTVKIRLENCEYAERNELQYNDN